MAALDLLGRRWTLRIVWELAGEPLSFRALTAACAVAPSVLNTRLAELREAGVVEVKETGYALSERGRSLLEALEPLFGWAERWAAGTTTTSGTSERARARRER